MTLNRNLKTGLIVGAAVALSFLLHLLPSLARPGALGKDAYFHIIQSRSLIELGQTHSPDYSVTPYLFAALHFLIPDWELAQKVYLAGLFSLITLAVWLVSSRFLKGQPGDRFLQVPVVLWSACSPALTFIGAEYMKQLLGLLFFLFFIFALIPLLETKPADDGRKPVILNYLAVLVLAVLTFFTHRIFGLFAFAAFLFLARPWLVAAGAAVFLVLGFLGTFFVPGLLNLLDAGRFSGAFSPVPHFYLFSCPVLARSWLFNWLEIMLPAAAVIVAVWMAVRGRMDRLSWYLLLPVLAGVFPFYQTGGSDLGFRMVLTAVPFAALWLFLMLPRVVKTTRQIAAGVVVSLLLAPGVVLTISSRMNVPLKEYAQATRLAEQYYDERKINPEMVIIHHGFSFYYTFLVNRHTLPFVPEWNFDPARVYRLVYGMTDSELNFYAEGSSGVVLRRLTAHYVLTTEETWRQILKKAENDIDFLGRAQSLLNPYSERPGFLKKFRRKEG